MDTKNIAMMRFYNISTIHEVNIMLNKELVDTMKALQYLKETEKNLISAALARKGGNYGYHD